MTVGTNGVCSRCGQQVGSVVSHTCVSPPVDLSAAEREALLVAWEEWRTSPSSPDDETADVALDLVRRCIAAVPRLASGGSANTATVSASPSNDANGSAALAYPCPHCGKLTTMGAVCSAPCSAPVPSAGEPEQEAGMPKLRCPWRVLGSDGDEVRQGYDRETVMRECLPSAQRDHPGESFRVVRLTVAEVYPPPAPSEGRGEAPQGAAAETGWLTMNDADAKTYGLSGPGDDRAHPLAGMWAREAKAQRSRAEAAERERDEERQAHDLGASILFRVGLDTPDGTSVGVCQAAANTITNLRAALTAAEAERNHARLNRDIHAAEILSLNERLVALQSQRDEAVTLAGEAIDTIPEAWRDGYDTGCDPAWCDKQLRRAGLKVEAHEDAARDFFLGGSETGKAALFRARLAKLTKEGT